MKKKSKTSLELVREYWPIIVFLISAIGSGAVLYYRVNEDEKKIDHHADWLSRHSEQIDDVRVECAKLGVK